MSYLLFFLKVFNTSINRLILVRSVTGVLNKLKFVNFSYKFWQSRFFWFLLNFYLFMFNSQWSIDFLHKIVKNGLGNHWIVINLITTVIWNTQLLINFFNSKISKRRFLLILHNMRHSYVNSMTCHVDKWTFTAAHTTFHWTTCNQNVSPHEWACITSIVLHYRTKEFFLYLLVKAFKLNIFARNWNILINLLLNVIKILTFSETFLESWRSEFISLNNLLLW